MNKTQKGFLKNTLLLMITIKRMKILFSEYSNINYIQRHLFKKSIIVMKMKFSLQMYLVKLITTFWFWRIYKFKIVPSIKLMLLTSYGTHSQKQRN